MQRAGSYVLRRKPLRDFVAVGARRGARYRVLTGCTHSASSASRVCALRRPGGDRLSFLFDGPGRGREFHRRRIPHLTKGARTSVYHGMIDTLAALHRIDPPAAGLFDIRSSRQFFERQVARWIKQISASETDRIEVAERLIVWAARDLCRRRPASRSCTATIGSTNLHSWLNPASKILAVLDWELSTLGDPLSDFSYFLMNWVTPVDGRAGLLGSRSRAASAIPTLERVVARYCEKTSRDVIQDLDWYFAFNPVSAPGDRAGHAKAAHGRQCLECARRRVGGPHTADRGPGVALCGARWRLRRSDVHTRVDAAHRGSGTATLTPCAPTPSGPDLSPPGSLSLVAVTRLRPPFLLPYSARSRRPRASAQPAWARHPAPGRCREHPKLA